MRTLTRIGIALGIIVSSLAFAQQQDFSKVVISVHKISGNIYMLQGEGGNIGVSVGDDGIVIVDDQYAPLADKIRTALKGITDKPLRFVINTHHHFDHAGGNEMFSREATLIAHDNVRKRIASGGIGGNGGTVKFESAPGVPAALPVVTFDHSLTLHMNGEDIRALHFPSGHTDGDSVVFFTKSNVVHMGDDFVTYGFPFVDLLSGGSVKGMVAACESVVAQLPKDVKVIPGHGPVSTLDDVRRYIAMLKGTSAAVAKGIKAGKSLEQLKKDKVLEPWKQFNGAFITADAFIDTLYNEQTGKRPAALFKH
ncbi:MAG: MBL fold metallo-hydrolase [Candidatus Obscuribacterales bacterium]|nr:MBL fold metallo-hydrolase [Steroidobacteraceae bacterium]